MLFRLSVVRVRPVPLPDIPNHVRLAICPSFLVQFYSKSSCFLLAGTILQSEYFLVPFYSFFPYWYNYPFRWADSILPGTILHCCKSTIFPSIDGSGSLESANFVDVGSFIQAYTKLTLSGASSHGFLTEYSESSCSYLLVLLVFYVFSSENSCFYSTPYTALQSTTVSTCR